MKSHCLFSVRWNWKHTLVCTSFVGDQTSQSKNHKIKGPITFLAYTGEHFMWKQILTQRSNCYQTCIFCTGYFPLQIDTTSCSKTQQNSCKCTGQISLQLSKYLCHSTPLKDYLSTCFMRSTLFAKRLLFCYFATYSNLITKGKMPVMQSSKVFFSGSIRFQQG